MQVPQLLKNQYGNLLNIPTWRRYLYGAVAISVVGYLAWCRFGPQPLAPGKAVLVAEPKEVAGESKKKIVAPVQVYENGERVAKKLGVNPPQRNEAVQQAVTIPRLKNGGKAVTFLNTTTGKSRTEIVADPSPWFSLERNNYLGGSLGASTVDGIIGRAYYKRDLLQVKGLFLQPELEVIARPNSPDRKVEAIGWANVEYRW